ncbi:PstS family phosphate ABC transporter substrate-binding protein [Ferrimonas lipolytica]|uniref:Phosphate-binding protein n=1 Tax=Ferrimonas lipolytica TaxID=2724191 RepID=A0A6H1UD81_9GAMM|nr:phosphate ABC transporter substrate-binding protein PstS family protein [Ferrimonas lipolytica]QIZ77031.1 phosphate ABC transporter substrate-binding protein PstS family protein [Ferrimonas lipolytica]
MSRVGRFAQALSTIAVIRGCAGLITALLLFPASAVAHDHLPTYEKVSGISGNLTSVGSDTLANVMIAWAEGFHQIYPNINPQIQAAGSSTAPPALAEGTSQLGPMSRMMKPKEVESFVLQHGYKPSVLRVAIDAQAVFVHQDNPITGITMSELDSIFSTNQRCGGEPIEKWGELGLSGSWAQRDIQLYGRNSVSGTYGYFKKRALCGGDFRATVNEQPGSASVVQSVSTAVNAIGYSGIGNQTAGVKALAIGNADGDLVNISIDTAADGSYPLSRYLYVYVNKHPNRPLDPLLTEFLKYILSKQGQDVVAKQGYVPLPSHIVANDFAQIGITL